MDDEPNPEEARSPRGRPRRWTDNAEKYREHRARRSALTAAVGELLHAVRNARLDDPVLPGGAASSGASAPYLWAGSARSCG